MAKAPKVSKAEPEPKRKRGNQSTFTESVASEVCRRLANGETLLQICRSEYMPPRTTILGWVVDNREGFADRYARARDLCLEAWSDEIVDVSDNAANDWMVREGKDDSPGYVFNGEHVNRSRLRVDSRKWLLSKLKPEKYGDKVQVGGDESGKPVQIEVTHVRDGISRKLCRIASAQGSREVAKQSDS